MGQRYLKRIGLLVLGLLLAGAALFCYASASNQTKKTETENDLKSSQDTVAKIYTQEYQDEVEERLEYAKSTEHYTEEAVLMEQNPYGTNTLSLYVYFCTDEAVAVSYTVSVEDEDIEDFSAAPAEESEYGTEHEFQVIGLVPDRENTISFTLETQEGETRTYEYDYDVGGLAGEEELKLETSVVEAQGEELSNGLYVILGNDSDGQDFMYYYDNSGTLRGEIPIIGYRSHRLLFQNDLMYYSISQTKIAAVNSLGKAEKIYETGKYELHHDYVWDDKGNMLVLATDTESDSVEDQVIRINTQTGEVDCVLDLGSLFGSYKEQCSKNSDGELDWMHINTIQWLGEETVILSSRETSSILKISGLYTEPKVDYIIGEESFWEGTGYEDLLLTKDESSGAFSGTGGQHTVTYQEGDGLSEGEYYLYMFDNNLGVSQSREDYDWGQIEGIAESMDEGITSYYYKYRVNEITGEYTLEQSFEVPFSAYVSSAQEYKGNILINSGMQGIFGEYDADGTLIQQFTMELADEFIYRVYKYDFAGFYFRLN